ncbi:hypothetical protein B0H12DRAFT_1179588 [Mycena haematopus]|nr:hypothetical protein B0H12DRAFT_1179588 [Mycena haematopus]
MLLFFLLPLPALLQVVDALLNVSVDDTDMSMISYKGNWEPSSTHLSGLDYGGSHTLSSDSAASATFTFTGIAVYYLSPRWPYYVSTRLSIDGGQAVLVNLTDTSTSSSPPGGSESAFSSVAWSATGLANTSHTVVATYGNYIVVDGFIYTVDNGSVPISSSSSASSSSASSSSPSSSSTVSLSASATLAASSAGTSTIPANHNPLTIGLGTAFGLAVLLAGLLVALALYQRRRYQRARSARPKSANNVLSEWGSYLRGRGTYAAVSTGGPAAAHGLEMSDSSSRLLYPPSSGRSDPWAPAHFSGPSLAPSTSTGRNASASASTVGRSASSVSSSNRRGLPVGARSPVIPGPYVDRAPPEPEPEEDDEDTTHNTPLMTVRAPSAGIHSVLNRSTATNATDLSRALSAGILFVVHPVDDPNTPGTAASEFRISSPPAYSER